MRYTKTVGYILLAVLFVSTLPCAAEAASIKIRPDQFKPVDPSNPSNYQEPAYIWGDGGVAWYYAVANLPVGKTITRLTFYHRGDGGSESGTDLYRTKFQHWREGVASIETSMNTAGTVATVSTTVIERPLVKTGYTYYVMVQVDDDNYVHGVKIHYE